MNNAAAVLTFACSGADSGVAPAELVGNKAAGLMRMSEAGLPVPPGLAITTDVCREFCLRDGRLPDDLPGLLNYGLERLGQVTGSGYGSVSRPLVLSVRSGAPVSMPGMMDTILNLGICDRTVTPLIRSTGNPRFVWDSYRRLVQAFGEVVHRLPPDPFERLWNEALIRESARTARELDTFALRRLALEYLQLHQEIAGEPFPQDPVEQILRAIEAVFRSWHCARAIDYRRLHGIDDALGTAVTLQAMVFGNMGSTSGAGVGFSRNPTTGENALYMDFLWNAQGEDVVSGRQKVLRGPPLASRLPAVDRALHQICRQLEQLFGDMQDFEFTVQEGRLFLLQSRDAKRTPLAAVRVACDLVDEGLIDEGTAVERLRGIDLDDVHSTHLSATAGQTPLAIGIPASSGVAAGPLALDSRSAVEMARAGLHPILVRRDISTDDIAGLASSAGVLTALGGRTSHAAVVARQLNKVCIVGCRDLAIENKDCCRIGSRTFRIQDILSLDGNTGAVYAGALDYVTETPVELLARVRAWREDGSAQSAS